MKKQNKKFDLSVRKTHRSRRRKKLMYDSFERRDLLTTFFVDSVMDDSTGIVDGQLTLREAIIAAETNAVFGDAAAGETDGDVIRFRNTISGETITLTDGEFSITDDVALFAGDHGITIDANHASRIFNVNSSERTVIRGLIVTGGSSLDQGGAILISGSGTTTLNELTISDSIGSDGGGIATFDNEVKILNSNLVNNAAQQEVGRGGAVFVGSGDVRVSNTVIAGNSAVDGGGIEVVDGSFSIFDSTVGGLEDDEGNSAGSTFGGSGGGIRLFGSDGSRINVVRTNILNNSASTRGGGIWNSSDVDLFVRDSQITGNASLAGGFSEAGLGGGIFNDGGNVRIRNSNVNANMASGASGSGGGAYSTDGLFSIIDSTVSQNTASLNGGGVAIVDGRLFIGRSLVDGNVAGLDNVGDGGGIHISGTDGTQTGIQFSTIEDNMAAGSGGGIWNASTARLTIGSSLISNNTASGNNEGQGGGGIFNDAGRTSLNNSHVDGNEANGLMGSGGGIYSRAVNFDFSIGVTARTSSIDRNVATTVGGGLKIDGGVYDIRTTSINRNVADPTGVSPEGNGGGLHISSDNITSRVTVANGEISDNVASESGGGVWIEATGDGGSTLAIRNGTLVSDNVANSADLGGGAIFNQRSNVEIFDSVVADNVVRGLTGNGGAFYTINGTINVTRSIVRRNAAPTDGGALRSDGGRHIITDSVITNNDAFGGNGGAISANGIDQTDFVILIGSSIEGNTAEEGGGIWWLNEGRDLEIRDGSVVRNNRSDSGNGGGVYVAGGGLALTESSLINNVAGGNGGGLYMSFGTEGEIRSSTISRNVASDGGGLFNDGSLLIEQTIFTNNAAIGENNDGDGGAIFTSETANTELLDIIFAGNTPNDEN